MPEKFFAATNGYTPRALSALRRRVIPIGSYQSQPHLFPVTWLRASFPEAEFSVTQKICCTTSGSPPIGVWCSEVGHRLHRPVSNAVRRSCKQGMGEVFPELAEAKIEFAWSGKVAYPMDHLPHAGRFDGVHYAMGYCGHGVALATYLGSRMGDVIAGVGELPDLGGGSFRAIPFYNGVPWFLPLIGGYYRARDWVG